ncbi:aminodeoxychorismate synthase OS=Lysinibacillus sphaericus OX=1421 GN=LS41612_11935 PE=4 SV=1 [Lysinibacillus sphaericus]
MYEISLKEKLEGVGCPMLVAPKNIEIEWASSPIDIYEKLFYGSKDSFWLDGELSSEFGSRFSIMGNCDIDAAISFMYYVQDSRLDITGPKGQESVYGDFYEVMDCIFSLITNEMPKEVLHPFNGGVIGYLGISLKALRGIPNKHSSDLPDAVLYLPKNIVVFDHQDKKRYVCNL